MSDDGELISAEWWHDVFGAWGVWLGGCMNLELCPFNSERDWRVYLVTADGQREHKLPHIKTRRDVRRLWQALTGRKLPKTKGART